MFEYFIFLIQKKLEKQQLLKQKNHQLEYVRKQILKLMNIPPINHFEDISAHLPSLLAFQEVLYFDLNIWQSFNDKCRDKKN